MDASNGALNRFSGWSGLWRRFARGWASGQVCSRSCRLYPCLGRLAPGLMHAFSTGDRAIKDMLGWAIHDHVARGGVPVDLQGTAG